MRQKEWVWGKRLKKIMSQWCTSIDKLPKLGENGNWILGCGTIYSTRSNTHIANIKHLYWTEKSALLIYFLMELCCYLPYILLKCVLKTIVGAM